MSESDPSNESERDEPSAVYRYYDYISSAEGNSSTVFIAISELLEHLPQKVDVSVEQVFDTQAYDALCQIDPRAADEKLALVPLRYIGPQLERSTCSSDEIDNWYDDVVKRIVHQTKRDHDFGCLSDRDIHPYNFMCGDSTDCPQRFLEDFLSKDAWMPDFGSRQYCLYPDRVRAITEAKLAIGEKYGIFTEAFAQATLQMYEKEYDQYITDLVQSFTGGVNNSTHN